ncbi:MAG TPA: MurR/RpiR family transcriptional regulator [Clostridia bacterium]|nr:MurR/RpiR family transcriptional regulator [Clostridiaceae bacterium]HOF26040.1 MurR/RpiR family transcriptional regulator [Clostridia bacterium]HOM33517.1 MurR/RpiR family transcriptional regulator [Clostridia bacterium]HOR89217.1 MurR/RpiR family transcriptional regulator [Clostridia bacterium]HOT70085.1 MurR/RpiR family transcriptional regulator [Clostridia bacterium]
MSIKDRLRNTKGFSKGQKKIAEYILANFDKAPFLTATKLAAEADTSESTVVRFAIELGYDGFPDMQRDMKEVARQTLTSAERLIRISDTVDMDNVLMSVMKSDIMSIRETMNMIDVDVFNTVVDKLSAAKRIYILGIRSSYSVALYMSIYFRMIFDNVHLVGLPGAADVFEEIISVNNSDAFIGITFPRYSRRTVHAMEIAKNNGAYTVALTDSMDAPITEVAHNVLVARSGLTGFVDSLTAPFSVVNALIAACGIKKDKELLKKLQNLEQIWKEHSIYTMENKKK